MKVVSLFSGAGGMDLGLTLAGHTIVWANDIYKDAVDTYKHNIGPIDDRDIRNVKTTEIPECDVVVGGFPCQGFSVANVKRFASDPRNALYKEIVRVLDSKKPKYFICENVKGLASLDDGRVLEKILKDFNKIGYNIQWSIVNAADYGVPQNRHRLIIFGSLSNLPIPSNFPPNKTHCDPLKNDGRFLNWISVGDALKHFPEPHINPFLFDNHTCSKYKLIFNGHLGHRTIDANKPAPTVTARGDEKGGVVVIHHPNNKRRITVREMAAIQSFPDNFYFYGTKTSGYRQIANAVPVQLAKAIGRMLSEIEIEKV